MAKRGRPFKVQQEHLGVLREIVTNKPLATLDEVGREFERHVGITLHSNTLRAALHEAGVERRRGEAGVLVTKAEAKPPRYGYTEAHRRHEPEQTYPSCLTDTEWALVGDLFDNEGRPGKPPRYSRRELVNACCYVVRTGGSWRMLPANFPPWQNVYRTFRRWSAQGKFEQMHDRLRDQWREREGRTEEPTAAVLREARPRAARAVTMRERRLWAASGTWWSIRLGWCLR